MFSFIACQLLLLLTVSVYLNAATHINVNDPPFDCIGPGVCHIDCMGPPGCMNKIINGSYASELIVNCAGGCGSETRIYCPYLDHTSCTITTDTSPNSVHAVAGTIIHLTANISNSFTLQCNADHSCQSVTVKAAQNVHQIASISLDCSSDYSCDGAIFNFTQISIINNLILKCFEKIPCSAIKLNGSEYISSFKLNGDITHSKINATVSNEFTFDANIFSETNIYINASNNVSGNVFGKFDALTLTIDGNKTHPSSNISFEDNESISQQHPSHVRITGMNVVHINCRTSRTCTSSVFTIENGNTMNMICGNNACNAIRLYSYYILSMSLNGYISSANIRAIIYNNFTIHSDSFSHNNIFINSENTVNGFIMGSYNYTSWTIETYGNSHSNVSLHNCIINESKFNFTNLNIVNINCNQTNACVGDVFNATKTNQLNIICNGTTHSNACKDTIIYPPYNSINSSSIKCIGTHTSCSQLNVMVSNDYIYDYMYFLTIPISNNPSQMIHFNCSKTKYDMIDKFHTITAISNYNTKTKQFICDPKSWRSCCPWIEFSHYNCNKNSNCNLNCSLVSTCDSSYINGSMATLLNITCNYNHVCRNALIECPMDGKCMVHCNKSHSCQNTQIIGNTSEIEIFCTHSYACDNLLVSATYAKSLAITVSGNYSLYNATVYALHAKLFQLTCIAKKNQYSCLDSNYYIPMEGFYLNCYATGCKSIGNIFVWNNIKKVTFKINGCKKCDSLSDCISLFNVYCGLYYKYSEQFGQYIDTKYDNVFTNSSCSNNTCGCNVLQVEGSKNFIDNLNDINCPHGTPNNNASVGIMSIGAAVIILCAVFICVFVYCLYRVMPYGKFSGKRKNNYAKIRR